MVSKLLNYNINHNAKRHLKLGIRPDTVTSTASMLISGSLGIRLSAGHMEVDNEILERARGTHVFMW